MTSPRHWFALTACRRHTLISISCLYSIPQKSMLFMALPVYNDIVFGSKDSVLILFEIRRNASWEGPFNEVGGVCDKLWLLITCHRVRHWQIVLFLRGCCLYQQKLNDSWWHIVSKRTCAQKQQTTRLFSFRPNWSSRSIAWWWNDLLDEICSVFTPTVHSYLFHQL